jgi:hypothetical protein
MSIDCVRKGAYLVVKDTIVAVHETENSILGVVVFIEDEWVLVVPPKPTRDMVRLSNEFEYDLPTTLPPLDTKKIASDLEWMHEQVQGVQRKLMELEEIKSAIKKIQEQM